MSYTLEELTPRVDITKEVLFQIHREVAQDKKKDRNKKRKRAAHKVKKRSKRKNRAELFQSTQSVKPRVLKSLEELLQL